MSKTLLIGSGATIKANTQTIKGISLDAYLVHTTNNTDFVATDFLTKNIQVKVTLKRGNSQKVLINDNVRNLMAFTNYFNPLFLSALSFITGMYELLAKGASAKTIQAFPMIIDFGGVIHLKGSDELECEVNTNSATINEANVNSSTSSIIVDFIQGMGVERGTPCFKSFQIQASETNPSVDLGNNVCSFAVLNYDKTDYLTANQVINSCQISSDKYSRNLTYRQLLGQQLQQFPEISEAKARVQSFMIYDNPAIPLKNVKYTSNTESSNVSATNNVLIWKSFEYSPLTLSNAIAREEGLVKEELANSVGTATANAMVAKSR